MSLIDDYENFKKEWKESSIFFKIIAVLLFFNSVSAIASLSEDIINWKGFFYEGLMFYRNYISGPIAQFLSNFGFEFSEKGIDSIILFNLSVLPLSRIQMNDTYEREKKKIRSNVVMYVFMIITTVITNYFLYQKFSQADTIKPMLIAYPVAFMMCYTLYRKYLVQYTIQIMFPILVICIFAAINKGLS